MFNSSAAVVSLRLFGAGAGFATQLVLARLLSPADLGMFFSVTSLAAVTGLLVVQGYPNLATRFVARYRNNPKLLGVFIRESTAAGRTWAVLAVAILLLNAAVWPGLSAHDRAALAVGALTVLPIAALNIHSALAGAMRRFDLCYGPESLLRPVGFLAAVALAATLPVGLSLETALVLFGAITLAIAVLQGLLLRTSLPAVPTRPPFQALARRWRREARALVPVSLFTALFADVALVIATPLLTKADAAGFGLSLKLAFLVGFVVQVSQHMAAPDLADARQSGNPAATRAALAKGTVLPSAASALALCAVAIGGPRLLAVFNPEFVQYHAVLVILVATQCVRALAGPSTHLLTLAGAQGLNAALSLSALLVLAGAMAVLVPSLGGTGAAFAVLFTYLVWIFITAVALGRLKEARTDLAALFSAPALLATGAARPASGRLNHPDL